MKIFVVDNEAAVREQLAGCIKEVFPDREVILFTDPMLAVKSMGQNPKGIDYVFSALLMRHIDGLELLELAKKFIPLVPVFLIPQTETWEYTVLMKSKGVADCLPQPVTAETIKKAVSRFEDYSFKLREEIK